MTEALNQSEKLTLQEAQAATRERMLQRIENLVQDDDLRAVLHEIGSTRFEQPENVSDAEAESLRQAHEERIGALTSYENIYGLQEATKSIFDLRGNGSHYRERWEADGAVFEPGLDKSARELATKYGLVGNTLPNHDSYDVQLNLGGAANSMIYRQTYGSKIVPAILRARGRDFHVETEVNLGSTRPIEEAERKRSLPYAQDARDEFDLAKRAAEEVHGITFGDDVLEGTDPSVIAYTRRLISPREANSGVMESEQDIRERYLSISQKLGSLANKDSDEAKSLQAELDEITLPQPPNKWRVATAISPEDGHNVIAISAGLQAGVFDANDIRKIRPNTADTYALLRGMLGDLPVGSRILVVTSAHFTGFQGADGERLAYDLGADMDIIGFDPTQFGEDSKPTHELLQEIHSLVSSTIGVAKYMGLSEELKQGPVHEQ